MKMDVNKQQMIEILLFNAFTIYRNFFANDDLDIILDQNTVLCNDDYLDLMHAVINVFFTENNHKLNLIKVLMDSLEAVDLKVIGCLLKSKT